MTREMNSDYIRRGSAFITAAADSNRTAIRRNSAVLDNRSDR
jgi:hypothetical protein